MWMPQQKMFCVLLLEELKSVKLVQSLFHHESNPGVTADVYTYESITK